MALRPIQVAATAAVLLVIVLSVDVSMNRTYSVDVWTGSAWRELTREPYRYVEGPFLGGSGTIDANMSDDIRFRIQLDNGWPLATSKHYVVRQDIDEVASGTLEAASRSVGSSEFTVPAERFFRDAGVRPKPTDALAYGHITIEVDGKWVYASVNLREVSK